MVTEDLVTVVIPVYNSKLTVEKTVRSILDQTYKNLEIIIVNDGSTDDSLEFCERLAETDPRIVIHSQENGGISAARNKGISLATGRWITFVDSDDLAEPDMISILINNAVNADAEISVCNLKKVSSQDFDIELADLSSCDGRVMTAKEIINGSLLNNVPLFAWGKLYKTELFSDVEFPFGRYFEDEITSLRLFCKAERSVFTDLELYYYVQNSSSVTKRPREKHATDLILNQADIESLLKDKDIDKKALYAHLCSNYTLAYNIIWKCNKNKALLKSYKQKNNEFYKLTDKKSIRSQPNGTSIILLHLGLYRILLGIRSITGKR
ncbi:MAG: glycosyltransferase family 2 protein [Clostridiales bacterium]|nr:glycosyltransferase family 2 protein [Clostridiales bacterium]